MYKERHDFLKALADRMNNGLQKLNEASEVVQQLSLELAQKDKDLAVANTKAEEVLKEVDNASSIYLSLFAFKFIFFWVIFLILARTSI